MHTVNNKDNHKNTEKDSLKANDRRSNQSSIISEVKRKNTSINSDDVDLAGKSAKSLEKQENKVIHHQVEYKVKDFGQKGFSARILSWVFSSPARLIPISFLLLITLGAILLSFPIASHTRVWTDLLTTTFTATSAVCVTGLILHDTATYWSAFGQIVIISLIQLGGIGLLTFVAALLGSSKNKKMNYQYLLSLRESTGSDDMSELFSLVRFVLLFTLITEAIGGIILSWRYTFYMPIGEAFAKGMFQGVSAFCNAGFDLMGNFSGPYSSLVAFSDDPIIILTTAFLLTAGGMGFIVWLDIFHWRKRGGLSFHSKVILRLTASVLLLGSVMFLLLEWSNTAEGAMGTLSIPKKILAAFFQTATLRTAGFNSLNQNTLRDSSKLLSVLIMFIGASPLSTGGGMKVSTIAIVLAGIKANIKGREETRIFHHRIAKTNFARAFVIVCMGAFVLITVTFLLLITEEAKISQGFFSSLDYLFEAISALATVGVTSVQSENISILGRIPLIIAMYIGRIGPVSFAIFFSMRKLKNHEEEVEILPEGQTFIG